MAAKPKKETAQKKAKEPTVEAFDLDMSGSDVLNLSIEVDAFGGQKAIDAHEKMEAQKAKAKQAAKAAEAKPAKEVVEKSKMSAGKVSEKKKQMENNIKSKKL